MMDEAKLTEAIGRLREGLSPKAIYLYGSHAYGVPGPDSDIDLLVVMDVLDEPQYEVAARAYRLLAGLRLPVEIQVVSEEEFVKRKTWVASVERAAHEKGVMLYAA